MTVRYWTTVIAGLLSTAFVMAGCADDETRKSVPSESTGQLQGTRLGEEFAKAFTELANKTVRVYESGHGTQIEYHSDSGFAYLWYPGNRQVVRGQWKLDFDPSKRGGISIRLCYRYGANTYNPVTKKQGGSWRCRPRDLPKPTGYERELVSGDVFGLANGGMLPCILNPERGTIAQILEKHKECKALPGQNRMPPLKKGS